MRDQSLLGVWIYVEFAYCMGTAGDGFMMEHSRCQAQRRHTMFVSVWHVSSGFPICFLPSMWTVQPSYRLERCELLRFLSAESLGSIDLSPNSLPMRAQASVVHSNKAFLAPGQIIDFATFECCIAELHFFICQASEVWAAWWSHGLLILNQFVCLR